MRDKYLDSDIGILDNEAVDYTQEIEGEFRGQIA